MTPSYLEIFESNKPRLIRMAAGMLGSRSDAEDVLQEAYIKWHRSDRAQLASPEAYLRTIVTRLCLDVLKSARVQRETYVGQWLPEPVVESEDEVPDITLPLMIALERLSPLERAAFILHDVFGLSFDEVAETLERSANTCRKLASRARSNIRADRPRFGVPDDRGTEFAEAFYEALRTGDLAGLKTLLAEDAVMIVDGGGKTATVLEPVHGAAAIVAFHEALTQALRHSQDVSFCKINTLPGFVSIEAGGVLQTTAFEIWEGLIVGIYIVRNPDKLMHVRKLRLNS